MLQEKPQNKKLITQALLFGCLLGASNLLGEASVHKARARHLTEAMFGHLGTRSKFSHQEEIEFLLHDLLRATPYQTVRIAKRTVELLGNHEREQKKMLAQDPANAPAIKHSLFLIAAQKGYLEEYAEQLASRLSWWQKGWGTLQEWCQQLSFVLRDFTWKSRKKTLIERAAYALDFYAYFEREHIFTDYQRTLTLFAQHKLHPVPAIMKFWSHPVIHNELLQRIRTFDQSIKIQMEGFIETAAEGAEGAETEMIAGGDQTIEAAATEAAVAAEAGAEVASAASSTEIVDTTASAVEDELGTSSEEVENEFALDEGEGTQEATPEAGKAPKDSTPEETAEEEPSKREQNKARRQEERAKAREELKTKEDEALNDPKTSKVKKAYIKMKQGLRTLAQKIGLEGALDWISDNVTGPINDAYQEYIYERFIGPIEKNALKEGIESLPGWMQPLVHITLQMSIISGGGLVSAWVSEDDQKTYLSYAKQQKEMAAINTRISTQVNIQKGKKMKVAFDAFNKGINAVTEQRSQEIKLATAEKMYREQAIMNLAPPTNFTVSMSPTSDQNDQTGQQETVMQIDQRFALSAMLTPDSPTPETSEAPGSGRWHNVFRSGNWIYSPEINGFYQTQLVKVQGTTPLEQGAQALYNTIFREYMRPNNDSYKIVVDCTLLNYDDPFFMGVVFNNARWISGVPDRYHQHRFAGIYGTKDAFYQVCEESENGNKKDQPNTLWPVYKVLNNPQSYAQTSSAVKLGGLPTKIRITVTTSPTKASVSIASSDNLQTPLATPLTQNNFQQQVFNFHGIGFMAAGCIAQFKIVEPQELVYSTAQADKFKTLISS